MKAHHAELEPFTALRKDARGERSRSHMRTRLLEQPRESVSIESLLNHGGRHFRKLLIEALPLRHVSIRSPSDHSTNSDSISRGSNFSRPPWYVLPCPLKPPRTAFNRSTSFSITARDMGRTG